MSKMKSFMNKSVFSTDKDKQLLYICRVSGNCKNLIALLEARPDIDINAAKYVSESHFNGFYILTIVLICIYFGDLFCRMVGRCCSWHQLLVLLTLLTI
jgi:hypothetical protein